MKKPSAKPTALTPGDEAPSFELEGQDGKMYGPTEKGFKYTVLFFYPKDNTPGCTIESKSFSAALAAFKKKKIRLLGVSGGDVKSKLKFCEKQGLKTTMLSDPDFKVATAYKSYGMKKFMGRSYKGIFRNTFVIDAKGRISLVFTQVKPEGHAEEVLAAI